MVYQVVPQSPIQVCVHLVEKEIKIATIQATAGVTKAAVTDLSKDELLAKASKGRLKTDRE